jgi:hypothetical protein
VNRVTPSQYCLPKPLPTQLKLLGLAMNYAMVEDPASTIVDAAWQVIEVDVGKRVIPGPVKYFKVEENALLRKSSPPAVSCHVVIGLVTLLLSTTTDFPRSCPGLWYKGCGGSIAIRARPSWLRGSVMLEVEIGACHSPCRSFQDAN